MKKLLEIANRDGWRAAIEGRLKEMDAEAYSYARDETRANWSCLLPAGNGTEKVLYAGRDFGSVSTQLAASYGMVVHLLDNEEEAKFLRLRIGKESRQKPIAVLGSILRAPFGEGVFDVAIIDGIEELSLRRARRSSLQESLSQAVESALRAIKSRGLLLINSGRKITAGAIILRLSRGAATRANPFFSKLQAMPGKRIAHRPLRAWDLLAGYALEIVASYAAIPHFKDNFYLLPGDSPEALKYLLKVIGAARVHLVSKKMRLALRVANFLLRLNLAGLLLYLIPASVVLAQKRSEDGA